MDAGLVKQLRDDLGYTIHGDQSVHFYKELVPPPEQDPPYRGMKNPLSVSAVTRQIAGQVYEHARQGRMVLTLGGDHSVATGTVAGTAKAVRERLGKEVAVVWVDAHADINTPELSESGNIHGMPLGWLTGLARDENEDYFGWLREDNLISFSKLVYIALRDVDPAERRILRENGIKAFSMFDIDKLSTPSPFPFRTPTSQLSPLLRVSLFPQLVRKRLTGRKTRHGIGRVVEMALAHIGADTPIHLSFDVDALDPIFAPSTGTPVRGGLTLREGDYICEALHETGNLVAVDLVEVNPKLAAAEGELGVEETIRAGCSIVRCALGESIL